jgi:hypothetical protein
MKQNTAKMRLTPAAVLAASNNDVENFLAAAIPGGIEAQEKRGQMKQAQLQTLPIEGTSKPEERKQFEALGFKFKDNADRLFVNVEFPAGWSKKPTDHSMWSTLVDDKGRKRAGIFYKAAFYEMSAHIHLDRRFGIGQDYDKPVVTVSIHDACGKINWSISGLVKPDYTNDRENASANYDKIEQARKDLWARLKAEYPDCDSPMAYWDQP